MKNANIVCGLVGMAFSAFAFIRTLDFPQFALVPIGPEFFPRYMAAGLFICSAILIIQSFAAKPKKAEKEKKAPTISPFDKDMRRLFAGIALIIVYARLWETVGFVIMTPLAMAALMFLMGYRKYLMMAIFAVGTTALVYALFSFFLNVHMPAGILRGIL
ncbi:MAG: tripartite tricarboxylate transporter TctB family protein [Treponema sp.]|nr:tripartite tricarboxylate transporter TctB family protein [Treponema sp.]